MTKMTRKEFWERHDALREASGSTRNDAAHMALHREYHAQWAQHVRALPGDLLEKCMLALANGDEHMNSPYTSLRDWDGMTYLTKGVFAEDHGTWKGWSLSLNTSILKEAARLQIAAKEPRLGVGTLDHMGRRFTITKAMTAAKGDEWVVNDYLIEHTGEGVLAEIGRMVIIAATSDMGVKL